MNLNMVEHRVLVTGSSRGIGRAIASEFMRESCSVVINGRDPRAVEETVRDLNNLGGGQASPFVADLGAPGAVDSIQEWLRNTWDGLDHLVCNIGSGRSVPPFDENREEWLRVLDINLLIAANCVRELVGLLEAGARRRGGMSTITFISSICGVEALGCPVVYASAKAALQTYSKNIATELAPRGIRVNCVTPGNILFSGSTWDTKLRSDRTAVEEMLDREVPLRRFGDPEEIASVVVFLSSERAGFATGANWIVDGGQTRSW